MLKNKKKKISSNNVSKLDLMKLKLLLNVLDFETIKSIKDIVDNIYNRKLPKEELL